MAAIWQKLKTAVRWIYDWITVLTASLVGLPSALIELLNFMSGVDITPLVGADKALKIVTGVALAKAVLAFLASRVRAN